MKSKTVAILFTMLLYAGPAQAQCDCSFQGDCDGSGSRDIVDLTLMIDFLFAGNVIPSDPSCPSSNRGDIDCNLSTDIVDLTGYVDYLFGAGFFFCDPCLSQLPPSDTLSPAFVAFYTSELMNAFFGSAPGAFTYINHPGNIGDSSLVVIGDTTIVTTRLIHVNDSAELWQYIPYPPSPPEAERRPDSQIDPPRFIRSDPDTMVMARIINTPNVNNNGEETSSFILIVGNKVRVLACECDFSEEFGWDPPSIQDRITDLVNNPPPPVSAQQIEQACNQDSAISVANSRIFAVKPIKITTWTEGTISKSQVHECDFWVDHTTSYDCTNQTATRTLSIHFSCVRKCLENGQETSSNDVSAVYYHNY